MLQDAFSLLVSQPLVSVTLTLIVVYVFIWPSNKPTNIPPIPQKPYPFLGHMPMLRHKPREKMREWTKSHGGIFSLYIGNVLTIVVSDFKLMKEAFIRQADKFSDRPVPNLARALPGGPRNTGIIQASGETWKEQRTVALSILREFGMGKNSLAEKVQEEVGCYISALKELNGKSTNIRTMTNNCVSNVICNILLGQRFDLNNPEFLEMLEILDQNFILAAQTGILNMYPWVRFMPGDYFKGKKLIGNIKKIRHFFQNSFIEPIKKRRDITQEECFISSYEKEKEKRKEGGRPTTMDDDNLLRVIINLFSAGSETTSTTIVWFVLLMVHNPVVLAKIQKEIEDVVGNERRPRMQDRSKLNFLNSCIMETQRFSSIAPFSLQHLCNETTTLGGYTIPKDSAVIPNLDAVLHSENIWKDPLVFRPERFLDDNGNLKSFEEFIPFSLGRRVCLGESLAKMELFLFISAICQSFNIQAADKDNLPPLKSLFGVTAPPEAYEVRMIQRMN